MASFRLTKVAKDFNVGIQTLVEHLAKKGHQVDANPNTKISEEQYELLASFPVGDDQYLAVAEPMEEEEPESVEVFFLKVEEDDDGNEVYVSVDDDKVDAVYEEFLKVVEAHGFCIAVGLGLPPCVRFLQCQIVPSRILPFPPVPCVLDGGCHNKDGHADKSGCDCDLYHFSPS